MTDEIEMMNDGSGMTWSETWIKALTQPTEQTYEEIANDPGASTNKAYLWIAVTATISAFISISLGLLFGTYGEESGGLIFLLCAVVLVPMFSIIGTMISAGVTQMVAGMLGGTGSFSKLVYPYAAFYAPITLITAGLSIIPILGLLAFPIGFYGLFLNVLAVKAVNQFSWGKAAISTLALLIIVGLVTACIAFFGLVLIAPVISEVFTDVMSEIQ
ncbi:MAG: YIP1 family protein [Chloroflexota bacterium]